MKTDNVRLIIIPEEKLPYGVIFMYWQKIIEADLLKWRLADVIEPTITHVKDMRHDTRTLGYYIIDTVDPDKPEVVAEFMLNNFAAKSAQVHFSMNPDIAPQLKLKVAREATDDVLENWKAEDDSPFLQSIYGLTPVTNRAACAMIQRVGFKNMGVLPGGCYGPGREVADAMMTVKKRE